MRVAVDARPLRPPRTGIGHYLCGLLPPLADHADLTLFVPTPIPPYAPSIQARWFIGPGVKGNIHYHLLLPHLIRREKMDLLLAPLNVLPFHFDQPSILILHDLTPLEHPEWHRLKTRLTTVPFYDDAFRRASRIVCVSHATQKVLHRYFPGTRSKSLVIHPGFPVPPEKTGAILPNLPEAFIFSLGTLEPRKNLSLLLDVHAADPTLPPLVIAGGRGWKEKIPNGKRIIHLDYITEELKWALYKRAALFVFPSLQEGFGLPVWEAAAAGCPIVTTPIPSATEFTLPNTLIVQPNRESLADGIRRGMKGFPKSPDRPPYPSWEDAAGRFARVMKDIRNQM